MLTIREALKLLIEWCEAMQREGHAHYGIESVHYGAKAILLRPSTLELDASLNTEAK